MRRFFLQTNHCKIHLWTQNMSTCAFFLRRSSCSCILQHFNDSTSSPQYCSRIETYSERVGYPAPQSSDVPNAHSMRFSISRSNSSARLQSRHPKAIKTIQNIQEVYKHMAMGQNLRYLFSRDYHLFKRLLRVTGGTGF